MASVTSKLNDASLELFSLVWLHDNPDESHETEQKLRSMINRLVKFKDVHSCQKYIEEESQNTRIILVVSGRLGHELVPKIYKFRKIISIYVYCMDRERNKKWSEKYSKVKAVVVNSNELISYIKANHKKQKIIEEPLSINIFNAGKSTVGVNGQFIFHQVLLDCLLRLKTTAQDKRELLDICKNQYDGNSEELEKIREFQREYLPSKALWWYTRDSFFYKTLNAALRNQDIHLIFLFRSYISDIQQHLQNDQIKHPLKVYRSQLISNDELESLEKCSGQLISINSFFSTSIEYQQALAFLDTSSSSTNDLVPILFEIEADPKLVITKPFANITTYSEYPDELEVLFMTGSIFRLKNIERNRKTNICLVQMTLCSEDDLVLKDILTHMKKQLGKTDTNLQILSRFLTEMGQFDLAEKYLIRLLEQLSSTHPSRADIYEELARITSQNKKFDKSMEWRQKAINFKQQNESNQNNLTGQLRFCFQKIFFYRYFYIVTKEKKLDRLPSPYKPEKEQSVVDKDRCNKCFKTFESGSSRFTHHGVPYHEYCFLCDSCFQPMGTKKFTTENMKHYCLPCYDQKFAARCVGCHQV